MAGPEYLDTLTQSTVWNALQLNDKTFIDSSASNSLKTIPAESKKTPDKNQPFSFTPAERSEHSPGRGERPARPPRKFLAILNTP
ncbi:MAG: hypothetical protein AAGD22_02680 [Verrucomicrobiota bacterium]